MSTFADKTLKCMECNQDFTYTVAEQELHQSLGYQNEPKRCNPCREAKRQRKGGPGERRGGGGGGGAPREGAGGGERPERQERPARPERSERGGGGGERGGPPRGGGGGGGGMQVSKEYHMAICAECGKEAQLPFKPQGDRPVFCGECFAKKRTPT